MLLPAVRAGDVRPYARGEIGPYADNGDRLGAPAAGTWLRFGHDLLASPGRVYRGRCVAPAARGSPRQAPRRERPGLLPGGGRRLPRPGLKRGSKTGRSPVDRGRTGSKHHLITDATGIPLAVTLTGGNRNDVTQLIPLLEAVPPVRGKRGRPRRRPDLVLGDRGYDKYRRLVRALGVTPVIARRGTEHGSGLGTQRWVVERAFAHLHWFRRLRIRWEIRDDIHQAFLALACALICWRRLVAVQRRHS